MASEKTTINLNDKVAVVLTDEGLEAYHQFYRKVQDTTNAPKNTDGMFEDMINSTERNIEIQLWSLIEIFGANINKSTPQLFERNELKPVLNLYDPCPCGSGKLYMQCCGK